MIEMSNLTGQRTPPIGMNINIGVHETAGPSSSHIFCNVLMTHAVANPHPSPPRLAC
jgi:hypothetical protein